ncbi:MAG: hypothetical protein Q4D77_02405 [Peptostreptococcaceae bacterium]|nr:hypothetical protein [Peptostreptococcaceae bacterium]
MENVKIYNAVRAVPKEAQKPIIGGRLRGKTDINPMWRIRVLTEQFGPAGVGWYYEIDEKWLDIGADGVTTANIVISLYVKHNGEWSKAIKGIGGATFIDKEKGGYFTDDDCYKKALTDAISVSCKALGIGADVYWDSDPSKYGASPTAATSKASAAGSQAKAAAQTPKSAADKQSPVINKDQMMKLLDLAKEKNVPVDQIEKRYNKKVEHLTIEEWTSAMNGLHKTQAK